MECGRVEDQLVWLEKPPLIRWDTGSSVNTVGYSRCVRGSSGDTCTPHLLFPRPHYSVVQCGPHWKTTAWPPTCDKADGDGAAAE